ncbi:MAG: VCBS repeat-containing protein [Acidobacteria bacterium]|nr:VCBS repeat-containing protein [Acidobacteriota bacterium]
MAALAWSCGGADDPAIDTAGPEPPPAAAGPAIFEERAAGDVDGDGWVDLYVTNLGSNHLWRSRGNGRFEDVTARAGVDDPGWSVPALFFDPDGDGDLDLFVGNYLDFNRGTHTVCAAAVGDPDYCSPRSFAPQPDRFFRNLGKGRFEEATEQAGLAGADAYTLGAVALARPRRSRRRRRAATR